MIKKNRMFVLLTIAAIMCLFGIIPIQAQTATSFSGDATGVIADVSVLGGTAVVGATIAPTGPLNSAGGRLTNQVAQGDVAATIQLGGLLGSGSTLSTGLITTRTSGGSAGVTAGDPGATNNSSQSQAVVNNLNLNIGAVSDIFGAPLIAGLSVTADTITANSRCECGPSCTGTSVIEDLRLNNLLVGTEIPFVVVAGTVTVQTDANGNVFLAAAPNSQIRVAVLGGTVDLFLNEQTGAGTNSITVNALRIAVNIVGVTANIIVAQAHSDINCSTTPTGSADLQVTNSCVNNNNVITCTTTVTNNGPSTATGIVVTENLSANTTFVSATGNGVTVTSMPAVGATGGTVTGSVATLGSGQSVTLTTVSNVPSGTATGTTISNTATVTSATPDLNPGNNTATGTAAVGAANSFSGNATGVIANANVLGTVTASAIVAPTGALPAAGGSLNGDVANANVQLGALGTANNLMTGVIQTRTSGGTAGGTPNSSQSRATVNNLNLGLLAGVTPIAVTATTVEATTGCRCTNGGPVCAGNTRIEDLRVNNVLVTATAIVNPAPNTVILRAVSNAAGVRIGTVTITLNQQTSTGAGDITVNALRIQIAALDGTITTDIIVAQAHSDIVCGDVTIGTTAASATIGGRVLTSKGRGLPGATVVLTDLNGQSKYALTNSRGYYNFSEVGVGETYLLSVRSKRYSYSTRNVFVTEELADLDFMPNY